MRKKKHNYDYRKIMNLKKGKSKTATKTASLIAAVAITFLPVGQSMAADGNGQKQESMEDADNDNASAESSDDNGNNKENTVDKSDNINSEETDQENKNDGSSENEEDGADTDKDEENEDNESEENNDEENGNEEGNGKSNENEENSSDDDKNGKSIDKNEDNKSDEGNLDITSENDDISDEIDGFAEQNVTYVYDKANENEAKILKSYHIGDEMKYRESDDYEDYYKAMVVVNNEEREGYIHKDDVSENEPDEFENIEGVAQKDPTPIYQKSSTQADTWRSYEQGTTLEYHESDEDGWYEATVFVDDQWRTGYIAADDVDTLVDNQEDEEGYAQQNVTYVYDDAYEDSSILKSYYQGDEMKYKTYSSDWYEATVVVNGDEQTGYIHKDDVGEDEPDIPDKLEGVSQKGPTPVQKETSTDTEAWKEYEQGTMLEYHKSDEDSWYEATVYANDQWRTGYIHEDYVDTLEDSQEKQKGYAQNNVTYVYDGAYEGSNILKSYYIGDQMEYKTYTPNWYEATVVINNEEKTGYIPKDAVDEEEPKVNEDIEGVATENPTAVYQDTATDAEVWKEYKQGATVEYHESDEDGWYEVTVFADDQWRTGYIQKDDVTSDIEDMMEAVIEPELPDGTTNGISIRDADTGESLYSHSADKKLRPASNMKLLTATAAMETLGPDYEFSTNVLTDGDVSDSSLDGDLYLQGQGDPTLLKDDLDNLAADLKEEGIEEIDGDIIGDDTRFDDSRLPIDMPWSDEPYYYGAPISALTISPDTDYDTGTVIVKVEPGDEVDDSVNVSTVPETDNVTIVNNANTVEEDETQSISVERQHGTNDIVVEGDMPLDTDATQEWSSVWKPTEYALDVFKESLEDQDIDISDDANIKKEETPENAEKLASNESMSLEEILVPFLEKSNNGHAEILTKEMGYVEHGAGTSDNGFQVINDVISDLGVDESSILIRDGSGISDKTIIPAKELSHLLFAVQDREWFSDLENALPVAGESGTLETRLTGESTEGNVVAKTGSLTGVSALSGYVTTKDGQELTFSILNNNFDSAPMTEVQDRIVTELAEHKFLDNE